MIDLTIQDKMLDIMTSMKGKTLKSIEGVFDFENQTFIEVIRLNLGQYAVEVISDYEPVVWSLGTVDMVQDEATRFSVFKKSSSEKRFYPQGCKAVQMMKNEIISDFIIVRDNISTDKDKVVIDSGIVLRTRERVYTFSRVDLSGIWFHFNESDKIDMYYSIKDLRNDCLNSERNTKAKIKRDYIFI